MKKPISGVVAVMLTPFTPQDAIDYAGLERLIEWYVANGCDALFAVCQNFHPHLYHWLYHHGHRQPELADDLALFLSLAATTEALGYPKNAKIYHQRLGTFGSAFCRANTDDVLAKHWSLSVLLDQIRSGTERYERKIAEAGCATDNVKRRT